MWSLFAFIMHINLKFILYFSHFDKMCEHRGSIRASSSHPIEFTTKEKQQNIANGKREAPTTAAPHKGRQKQKIKIKCRSMFLIYHRILCGSQTKTVFANVFNVFVSKNNENEMINIPILLNSHFLFLKSSPVVTPMENLNNLWNWLQINIHTVKTECDQKARLTHRKTEWFRSRKFRAHSETRIPI